MLKEEVEVSIEKVAEMEVAEQLAGQVVDEVEKAELVEETEVVKEAEVVQEAEVAVEQLAEEVSVEAELQCYIMVPLTEMRILILMFLCQEIGICRELGS